MPHSSLSWLLISPALTAALPGLPGGAGDQVREMGPAEHHCDVDRECSADWEPRQDMFRAGWMHQMLSEEQAKKKSKEESKNQKPPKCVSPGCVEVHLPLCPLLLPACASRTA